MPTIEERFTQARHEHQAGRLDAAEALYRAILVEAPQDAATLEMLGMVAYQRGRNQEALGLLTQALIAGGPNPRAYSNLAAIWLELGQPGEAITQCRHALALDPNLAFAHAMLGVALRRFDRQAEAEAAFREALRCDPHDLRARASLAQLLTSTGRPAEARAEYETILAQRPDDTRTIFILSELAGAGHFEFSAAQRAHIAALAARPDLPEDDQCRLAFALAVLYDQAGDCAAAFEHMCRGNRLRSAMDRRFGAPPFDADAHRRAIDMMIEFFTPAYFERVRGLGSDSELPVFIVGMMRSGTTLVEQILASHPEVYGAGELREIGLLHARLPRILQSREQSPWCLTRLDRATAQALAGEHVSRLRLRSASATRIIDKFPLNLLFIGMIVTLFPRARIIHCRRDPFDTCMSCFYQNFNGPFSFKYDLGHLGLYYREYERLMAHWRTVVPILDVQYEELIAEPEAGSRRLVAYCGLEWDERCLRFHETERSIGTASLLQVRRPMYRSGVGRWRRYEPYAGPLVAALEGR
jgi:tetratricopeptide (TPR) repeat protein